MALYLLRHLKTTWNAEGRLQGDGSGGALLPDEAGFAAATRDALAGVTFDHFFVSPLERARQSLALMLPHVATPCPLDGLREISFGTCTGKRWDEVDPEFLEQRRRDKWHARWPGGESHEDVYCRLEPVLAVLPRRGITGVLAHETVNRVLIGRLLGWDAARTLTLRHPHGVIYRIDQGELEILDLSRQWHRGYFPAPTLS